MKIRKFNENQKDNNLYDALQNIKDILNVDDEYAFSVYRNGAGEKEMLISEIDNNDIEGCNGIIIKLYETKIISSVKDSNEDVFNKSIKFFKNLIRINNTLPDGWKLSSDYKIDLFEEEIEIVLLKNEN